MDAWPLTEPALARTYNPASYADAYEAILDYRRVQKHHSQHPDDSAYSVSKELELPRGRVRSWMNGNVPDALSGVRRAHELAWLDLDGGPDDDRLGAFVTLLAGIYSGGSVRKQGFAPRWTTNGPSESISAALARLGVGFKKVHEDDPDRATELAPANDGSLLGRCLVVLGAPLARKGPETLDGLPTYLFHLSKPVRWAFVDTYLAYRARANGGTLQILEDRTASYRNDLARLLNSVIDDSDEIGGVTVGDHGLYVPSKVREKFSV